MRYCDIMQLLYEGRLAVVGGCDINQYVHTIILDQGGPKYFPRRATCGERNICGGHSFRQI